MKTISIKQNRFINLFNTSSLVLILGFSVYSYSSNSNTHVIARRFVSTRFNNVQVYKGPTKDSPIQAVIVKKGEPLEVIGEHEEWYKIKDFDAENGWIHSSGLSKNRFVIINSNDVLDMLTYPKADRKVIAKLSPQLRCALKKCAQDWCQIKCKSYQGWVMREKLWGISAQD